MNPDSAENKKCKCEDKLTNYHLLVCEADIVTPTGPEIAKKLDAILDHEFCIHLRVSEFTEGVIDCAKKQAIEKIQSLIATTKKEAEMHQEKAKEQYQQKWEIIQETDKRIKELEAELAQVKHFYNMRIDELALATHQLDTVRKETIEAGMKICDEQAELYRKDTNAGLFGKSCALTIKESLRNLK